MNTADIKIDIFRRLDGLKDNHLKKVYGALLNLLNDEICTEDWEQYSQEQKKALLQGIDELERNEVSSHNEVIQQMKKRFL